MIEYSRGARLDLFDHIDQISSILGDVRGSHRRMSYNDEHGRAGPIFREVRKVGSTG